MLFSALSDTPEAFSDKNHLDFSLPDLIVAGSIQLGDIVHVGRHAEFDLLLLLEQWYWMLETSRQ